MPSLSSVRSDSAETGRYLAALILSELEDRERPEAVPVLGLSVIPRESTAAPGS
ncbi:hypothetical protein GCM10022221_48330 [Actinocorallia aurea]